MQWNVALQKLAVVEESRLRWTKQQSSVTKGMDFDWLPFSTILTQLKFNAHLFEEITIPSSTTTVFIFIFYPF